MADILDKEASFHWSLAFKKSGHPPLCNLWRDLVLEHCRRDLAPVPLILEAIRRHFILGHCCRDLTSTSLVPEAVGYFLIVLDAETVSP